MKLRRCRSRLEPERLGEFSAGLFQLRILDQQHTEFIVQIGTLRIELTRRAKFGDGGAELVLQAQRAAEAAVGLGVAGRKLDGDARLTYRGCVVSLGRQRVGEIDVRLQEVCLQPECGTELRDGVIDLSGGHQYPAQRVVSCWSVRREPYDFLKVRAGRIQIASLQSTNPVLIEVVDGRLARRFLRQDGRCEGHEDEQRRPETYFCGGRRNQESARKVRTQRPLSQILLRPCRRLPL